VNTFHQNDELHLHFLGRLQGLVFSKSQGKLYLSLPTQQFALPDVTVFSVRLLLFSTLKFLSQNM
jgi:hypothetical protein